MMRSAIEEWVYTHLAALEERAPTSLCDGLADDVRVTQPRAMWQSDLPVQAALAGWLARQAQVRLHLRRFLVDEDQRAAGVEWVLRATPRDGGATQQLLGVTVLLFDDAGALKECHTRCDMPRSGPIAHLHAPWPGEQWTPAAMSATTTRDDVERAASSLAAAWSGGQRTAFFPLLHDEVHLCPPWDYRIGHDGFMVIVDHHFAVYRNTCVTVQRVIYDKTQPTFGMVMQEFACTNPATGQAGADADIAFVEVVDGKLRYWRNYFDAEASVQTSYAEIGRPQEAAQR